MDYRQLIKLLESSDKLDDNDLIKKVQDSYELSQKIVMKDNMLSASLEYDIFDKNWIKKNWKTIIKNTGKIVDSDAMTGWILTVTTIELAKILQDCYQFSETTIPAMLALAILIKRLCKDNDDNKEK